MRNLRQLSLFVALFLSGGAALAYQTTWGRMLDRVFGVGDLAVATVLAAFFLGLGIGSALGGRVAARLRFPVWTYAGLEVAIGLWALLSLLLVPNVHALYTSLGAGAGFGVVTAIRFALALAVLLPPTILMGATLPILVRVVARSGGGWSRQATALYVVNTLGAATGAGLTGLYLLPTLGNRLTLMSAAGASVAGGLLVLALYRRRGQVAADEVFDDAARIPEGLPAENDTASSTSAAVPAVPAVPAPPSRVVLACALAAMAGLSALSGEVLWTRVLRIVVHGTTPAFASMLVCYLTGIAGGSVLAERLARRGDPGRLFGHLQALLAALTIGSMALAPHLPRLLGLISGEADLDPYRTWTILATAAALLLPLSLALGTSIPLAWRLAGGGAESAAKYAGRVLAWNTLGGLLGSVLVGFMFVPWVGVEGTLMGVAAVHITTAAVAYLGSFRRLLVRIAVVVTAIAAAAGIFVSKPSINLPFLLHARNDATNAIIAGPAESTWESQIVFMEEGRNTTVTVTDEDGLWRLYNDGRPESGFGGDAPGFGAELSMLGSLPTLFAKRHDRAMVIGLGAGHTAAVMLGGPWETLDVVELEGAVVTAARRLYEHEDEPFPLDDERANLIVDDARARLVLSSPATYDAIVSQPSHPWLAGSSALYTAEFFAEAARALTDDGVMCIWVNLFRTELATLETVTATLRSVFPYGHAFVVEDSSFILIASRSPIPLDETVAERVRSAELRPYMQPQGLDHIVDLAAVRELDPQGFIAFGAGAPLISDDRPVLEFTLAQTASGISVAYEEIDRSVLSTPWLSPEAFEALPAGRRDDILLARIREVENRAPGLLRLSRSLPALDMPRSERELILGRIAEARGDARGALGHYDASTDPDAAEAADDLRYAERALHRLLAVARDRETHPDQARSFLSAAFAVGDDDVVARALEVAAIVDAPGDTTLIEVLLARRESGCEGLLGAPALAAEIRQDEYVAFEAERCAFLAGDEAGARHYSEERMRTRRALALREGKAGREAETAGNRSAALRHFRRSIAANPAHGPSSAAVARILWDRGETEEAAEILRRAADAAEGLPQSAAAIENAASSLGINLGIADGEVLEGD